MSPQERGRKPALIFALYSEDSADTKRNLPTLRAVLCSMLELIREDSKPNHLDFRPAQDDRARQVHGPFWKVKKSKDQGSQEKRRILLEDIATALLQGRVVFFHVDGDCRWREQKRAEVWQHLERFRRDLRAVAAQVKRTIDDALLEEAFIEAIPFCSIESWTFANTRLLREKTSDPAELATIDEWEENLALLDEQAGIKERLPSIRDRHNAELARSLPAAALKSLDKSYAKTVARLERSSRIKAGLAESAQRPW